jgi:hypothetical protein
MSRDRQARRTSGSSAIGAMSAARWGQMRPVAPDGEPDAAQLADRSGVDETTFLGRAQMAETLRGEVSSLLVAMRAG